MKKFVISWISFFDNELYIDFIEASDYVGALRIALYKVIDTTLETNGVGAESLKDIAFDMDAMIEAKEII